MCISSLHQHGQFLGQGHHHLIHDLKEKKSKVKILNFIETEGDFICCYFIWPFHRMSCISKKIYRNHNTNKYWRKTPLKIILVNENNVTFHMYISWQCRQEDTYLLCCWNSCQHWCRMAHNVLLDFLWIMDELPLGHVSEIETNCQSILFKMHLYTYILFNCFPFIKSILVNWINWQQCYKKWTTVFSSD